MDCQDDPKFFSENDTVILSILNGLHQFQVFYRSFHRYISLFLCLFGLFCNFVHIWILTRPRMLPSSVHTVLTCIAIADIGTMTSYLIYLLRYEFSRDMENGYPYGWVLFLKIHAVTSIALHGVSLYLVVFMAYIRLCAIRTTNSRWLKTRLAGLTSLTIALAVFILCVPTLLAHEIYSQKRALQYYTSVADNEHPSSGEYNQEYYDGADVKYSIGFSAMVLQNNCILLKMNLWLTGIMLKAVPCFLLLWLTFALLLKLQANNKKRMLRLGIRKDTRKDGSLRDRTTSMLLLMLCVFLSTELPQGFMAVLNAIYTKQFHLFVYLPLADVLDLLSLINCYVGFTVFFCTSTRYRQTLLTLFPQQCTCVTRSQTSTHNSMLLQQALPNRDCTPETDENLTRKNIAQVSIVST
uniref:G-protein coupled receptors family 1 profile domain-containing protein n=1 Tax=Parascaris univalens TaxID=6257 RepID=A0A914ZQU1_PARUN